MTSRKLPCRLLVRPDLPVGVDHVPMDARGREGPPGADPHWHVMSLTVLNAERRTCPSATAN